MGFAMGGFAGVMILSVLAFVPAGFGAMHKVEVDWYSKAYGDVRLGPVEANPLAGHSYIDPKTRKVVFQPATTPTVEYDETLSHYMADCGSVLNPADPPVDRLIGRESEVFRSHTSNNPMDARSGQAAVNFYSQESKGNRVAGDSRASAHEEGCPKALTTQRWWTFALSPFGWVAIALAMGLALMVIGMGSGGGGGSLTPNLLGGGFTLRFWR